MTGYTAQKLYFQFDKMNNRKLQKSQQFIPAPSNSILAKSFLEPRMARINTDGQRSCRAMLGQAKLALCFQIPSQASLRGIVNPHRPFCYANGPASTSASKRKNRVALGLQAGRCCEKASASPLARVFCKTDPAFAQRIKPVLLGLPIRVYLGNPWLKNDPFGTE